MQVEVSLLVAMQPTADRPQQVQVPTQQLHSVGRSMQPAGEAICAIIEQPTSIWTLCPR